MKCESYELSRLQKHFIAANESIKHPVLGPVYAHSVGPVTVSLEKICKAALMVLKGLSEMFAKAAWLLPFVLINAVRKIVLHKKSLNNPFSFSHGANRIAQGILNGLDIPRIFFIHLIDPKLLVIKKEIPASHSLSELANVTEQLKDAKEELNDIKAQNQSSLNQIQELENQVMSLAQFKEELENKFVKYSRYLFNQEENFSIDLVNRVSRKMRQYQNESNRLVQAENDVKFLLEELKASRLKLEENVTERSTNRRKNLSGRINSPEGCTDDTVMVALRNLSTSNVSEPVQEIKKEPEEVVNETVVKPPVDFLTEIKSRASVIRSSSIDEVIRKNLEKNIKQRQEVASLSGEINASTFDKTIGKPEDYAPQKTEEELKKEELENLKAVLIFYRENYEHISKKELEEIIEAEKIPMPLCLSTINTSFGQQEIITQEMFDQFLEHKIQELEKEIAKISEKQKRNSSLNQMDSISDADNQELEVSVEETDPFYADLAAEQVETQKIHQQSVASIRSIFEELQKKAG